MTRLERLARLRVKLAAIERTKAGSRAGQLDGRVRQVAALADSYGPDAGTADAGALAARAAFADRLARNGELLAREARQAHVALLDREREVHRAEKTVERVADRAKVERRGLTRRLVRGSAKEGL